ncbi:MAG TPA: hypothetical protein VJW76_12040, partial [Verrucomicrobiae bacterium]|nr:hypothetical protein [Verrucomicrobiae bacterium]
PAAAAWKAAVRFGCGASRAAVYRGFQTRRRIVNFDVLPIWKSAIRQVWKPALRGLAWFTAERV